MATRAPDYALEGESGDRERYLVLAHQAGDPFAFTEIVKDHYTALYAHAIRRMGDQRAAEDVVQDALLRAYRGLDKFSGEYKLSAWLHRIVDNVCADEGSRRQREAKLAERWGMFADVSAPAADEYLADDHAAATVRSAVASLPDSYREALVLRDVMDMEYADVAEQIGITEQNARARVSRARAALRKMVAPTFPVWVFVVRAARRRSLSATRIAAKLTTQLTSAAGQATTSVTQATAAAASTPPDVLAAPIRLAPAISTLAVTAVAAVASVGIPAFVTSTRPSPVASPVPHFVQVASGPTVTDSPTTLAVKPVVAAAANAPSTTSTSTTSTSTTSTTAVARVPISSSGPIQAASPIPTQGGAPLPPSRVLGTLLTVVPLGSGEQLVGTARLSWGDQVREAHLKARLNPTHIECESYFGGTLDWLEGTTTQGYLSFAGWITGKSTIGGLTSFTFVATVTSTGPSSLTGSGWLSGTINVDSLGSSLDATGWGPGHGAAPLGPPTCSTTAVSSTAPSPNRPVLSTTSTAVSTTTSITLGA